MRADAVAAIDLRGGPAGVLLLHGLFGTPAELGTLAQALGARGFSVLVPCLAGHDSGPDAVARAGWRGWLRSATDAYSDLAARHQRVAIGGLSMGAALAFCLASAASPRALVSISGLVDINNPLLPLLPLALRFVGGIKPLDRVPIARASVRHALRHTLYAHGVDLGDERAVRAFARRYVLPLAGIDELRRLLAVTRRRLPLVHSPTLLLQGRLDRVIPRGSLDHIRRELGTDDVEAVWFERSGHLLPIEAEASAVIARVVTYLAARLEH